MKSTDGTKAHCESVRRHDQVEQQVGSEDILVTNGHRAELILEVAGKIKGIRKELDQLKYVVEENPNLKYLEYRLRMIAESNYLAQDLREKFNAEQLHMAWVDLSDAEVELQEAEERIKEIRAQVRSLNLPDKTLGKIPENVMDTFDQVEEWVRRRVSENVE